jgi:acetyltransferase-like isoleucine patch superfamily enzyme
MRFIQMLKYPFLGGLFLPIKVYTKAGIKINRGAKITLGSRLTLGNGDPESPIVSRLPINIFLGSETVIVIGKSVSIGPGVNIIVKKGASFSVGDHTYFTSDSHMEVVHNVTIGSNCAISWGVTIIDDNHHQVLPEKKGSVKEKEVKIGDHVWIGCHVTILKGTVLGNNCIVAAGSIVKGKFPDNVLIAGNPAKIVKQEINWK